jgi:hypothetical protein
MKPYIYCIAVALKFEPVDLEAQQGQPINVTAAVVARY